LKLPACSAASFSLAILSCSACSSGVISSYFLLSAISSVKLRYQNSSVRDLTQQSSQCHIFVISKFTWFSADCPDWNLARNNIIFTCLWSNFRGLKDDKLLLHDAWDAILMLSYSHGLNSHATPYCHVVQITTGTQL